MLQIGKEDNETISSRSVVSADTHISLLSKCLRKESGRLSKLAISQQLRKAPITKNSFFGGRLRESASMGTLL
jgi:hypothetical protein